MPIDIDKEVMIKKMRASKFKQNNAKVLLTINILRHQFEALSDVKYALEKMEESEFLDSINFLCEENYIKLRTIDGHQDTTIADTDYAELEAKVTSLGIRLLAGEIKDAQVEV